MTHLVSSDCDLAVYMYYQLETTIIINVVDLACLRQYVTLLVWWSLVLTVVSLLLWLEIILAKGQKHHGWNKTQTSDLTNPSKCQPVVGERLR